MIVNYNPEPTPTLFHNDNSFVRCIRGPFGSGKSVACCMEILSRSMQQEPNEQGIRKTRWGVARATFPQLKSTTIKTWQDWIPDSYCPIVYSSPIVGHMIHPLSDGTIMDMEIFFISLDKEKDAEKLLSMELTGAWLNEAKDMSKSFLDALTGRVGRYPSKRNGSPTWSGIIMDTNAPDNDNWIYKCAEEEEWKKGLKEEEIKKWKWSFYSQPAALLKDKDGNFIPNPEAENVINQPLGYDYWLRMIPGKSDEWIKIFVLNEYGVITDGRPVWPEYKDSIHCVERLDPIKELPLIIGLDFGLSPAAVFCQISSKGQLLVLDEIVSENMGIRQFAEHLLKPHLFNEYPQMRIRVYGDPAGNQRAQTDEKTCFEELGRLGISVLPASTNNFTARRDSVANFLLKMQNGEPGFLISSKCKTVRNGLLGRYQLDRIKVANDERYRDHPNKNKFSHPCEAMQYAALGVSPEFAKKKRNALPVLDAPRGAFY